MRNENEISLAIKSFEVVLFEAERKRNQLNQIDLLSGEGSRLSKIISQTEGKIDALKWVIESK